MDMVEDPTNETFISYLNESVLLLGPPSVFFNEIRMEGSDNRLCNNSHNTTTTTTTTEANPIINSIRSTELVASLLINIALFFFMLTRTKLRKKHSVKLFSNLQLVHVLLSLLLLLRTFDYGHDDVTLHVINGFLVQMFLSMVACTLDRLVAIKYPYVYERVATKQVNTV